MASLEPDRCPASVEEMARDYLAVIREVQPTGPYHLLGWSFGGLVAHAMATALRAKGERVAFLGLMDSYPASARGVESAPPDDQGAVRAVLDSLGFPSRLDGAAGAVEVLRAAHSPLAELGEAGIGSMARVFAANVAASSRHTPDRFDGDVLYFTATACRPADLPTPLEAWRPFVTGEIDERPIGCAHGDMTKPEPLAEIAAAIASRLAGKQPDVAFPLPNGEPV